jgi:hypothetical protein
MSNIWRRSLDGLIKVIIIMVMVAVVEIYKIMKMKEPCTAIKINIQAAYENNSRVVFLLKAYCSRHQFSVKKTSFLN